MLIHGIQANNKHRIVDKVEKIKGKTVGKEDVGKEFSSSLNTTQSEKFNKILEEKRVKLDEFEK